MNIDNQIKKTKEVLNSGRLPNGKVIAETADWLILKNQLVILQTLKEISYKRDRSEFGPG